MEKIKVKVKLKIKRESFENLRNVNVVFVKYEKNYTSEENENEFNYEFEYAGEFVYLHGIVESYENEILNLYYKLFMKDGNVKIENYHFHNYSFGVENYIYYLKKLYNERLKKEQAEISFDKIDLSIIIPIYNNYEYLPLAIESILQQRIKDFEIIIIDDGSTEKIDEIINQDYSFLKNLKYINFSKNKGVGFARNYGIKIAQGEYIAWLDSDDVYLPDYFEKAYDILKSNNALDAVFTHNYDFIPKENNLFLRSNLILCPYCTNYDEDDNPKLKPNDNSCAYKLCEKCKGTGYIEIKRYDYNLLKENCFIINPTSIIRRKALLKFNGYDIDIKVGSDWDYWLRSLNEENAYLITIPLLIKRIHKNSIWQNMRSEKKHNPNYYREILKNKYKIKELSLNPIEINKAQSLDFIKNKKVVIYPYNKEVNNLILFKELLNFEIIGVIDYIMYENGDLGEIIFGKKNGVLLTSSESKAKELIGEADAFLIFDVPHPEYDMKKYYTKFQTSRFWYENFEKALTLGKDIYSTSYLLEGIVNSVFYKEKVRELGINYFYPIINYNDYINNYKKAQEYEFNYAEYKPKIISFFGIGPNIGKFSSQMILTKYLNENGFKTKHISTEPYGDLFGSITACNEKFNEYKHYSEEEYDVKRKAIEQETGIETYELFDDNNGLKRILKSITNNIGEI